MEIFYQDSFKK